MIKRKIPGVFHFQRVDRKEFSKKKGEVMELYIPEFWLGAAAVIAVEIVAIVAAAIWQENNKKK